MKVAGNVAPRSLPKRSPKSQPRWESVPGLSPGSHRPVPGARGCLGEGRSWGGRHQGKEKAETQLSVLSFLLFEGLDLQSAAFMHHIPQNLDVLFLQR